MIEDEIEKVIVVAHSLNRVIGINNTLPWSLPADLAHFKKVTMGHPLVMGRKTYESIGRPLPGRTTIVVTRQNDWSADGVIVVHSLESAYEEGAKEAKRLNVNKIMLVGGADLYAQSISLIKRIVITVVNANISGDAVFPELNANDWKEVYREDFAGNETNTLGYSFVELERICND